eukprot:c17589_g1_i1 orf=25-447(+)
MAPPSSHRRNQPLLPNSIYTAPGLASAFARSIAGASRLDVVERSPCLDDFEGHHPLQPASSVASAAMLDQPARFTIATPSEPGKIALYSPQYYAACTFGGILSCGLTHTAVTPLDLVKCNMQINPAKYKSIGSGFGTLFR